MQKKDIVIAENGLYVKISITEDGDTRLVHFGPTKCEQDFFPEDTSCFRLVEIQEAGFNHRMHHGSTYKGTEPGRLLRYHSHKNTVNRYGRKLEITQEYEGLYVTSHLQFYTDIPVVRSWTSLENRSKTDHILEYVSSFALTGLEAGNTADRDNDTVVYIPHNTWFGEAQWKQYTLHELGYDAVNDNSVKRIGLTNTGTWSCSSYLPMGSYENKKSNRTFTWQIETSGSWNWEISDIQRHMYVQLSGPTSLFNGFEKKLQPGQSFESVPCAMVCVVGNFEKSIQEMTKYRRVIRRKNKDNEHPTAIFNDYMNCLMGDPTTEKLLPLIDAASKAGCQYFCIDCGWYDDGPWWDGVGEWLPAKHRFPNGIREPLEYIRKKGMIPGLWLELEVMGIHCPLVSKVSKDWFFQRCGKILIDENRYQLDYRNPEVRKYATEVIRRLVEDYGVGYIKMDYNIDPGVGTDLNADSFGEGLLAHKRAYQNWLDNILDLYPDLVFENCSSGGMRMDYSMLSRCCIQSVTDQMDYLKTGAIAANCMTAVTPEQAAIWSYPLRTGDAEEVVFNMINAMLMRIHQSGHLSELTPERLALVTEGIDVFNRISQETCTGLPFWPTGLATMQDRFISVGVDCGKHQYLAVWCTQDKGGIYVIPMKSYTKGRTEVRCIYPQKLSSRYEWNTETRIFSVTLEPKTARLFEFENY